MRFMLYIEAQRNFSKHTLKAYNKDLNEFAGYAEKQNIPFPAGFDRFLLRGYMAYLGEMKLSRNSLLRKISSLRSFVSYLINTSVLSENPFDLLVIPKKEKKLPHFLTEGEIGRLQDANAPEIVDTNEKNYYFSKRDFALFELMYSSGLRRSEASQMNIGDVDFYSGLLRVRGKGNKERIIPVGNRALSCLRDYLNTRPLPHAHGDPLFLNNSNTRLTDAGIAYIFNKMAKRARFTRKLNPHSVRHSFATHILDNGCDLKSVQEMLGHKNLQTTEIYTHVSLEHLKDVYNASHPDGDKHDK